MARLQSKLEICLYTEDIIMIIVRSITEFNSKCTMRIPGPPEVCNHHQHTTELERPPSPELRSPVVDCTIRQSPILVVDCAIRHSSKLLAYCTIWQLPILAICVQSVKNITNPLYVQSPTVHSVQLGSHQYLSPTVQWLNYNNLIWRSRTDLHTPTVLASLLWGFNPLTIYYIFVF